MQPAQSASPRSYLERLNIPREQVARFLEQAGLNLFQASIAVLLLHGHALPLPDLAARLEVLGFSSGVGDMEHSLLKAWHGQLPIYRDDANRFGLELHSPNLEYFLLRLRLYNRDRTAKEQPPTPPSREPLDDDRPLTQEELDAAFSDRCVSSLSVVRKIAAVLDAWDESMTPEQVNEHLRRLSRYHLPVTAETLRYAHSPLIQQGIDGRLSLCKDHPDLLKVRREVRRIAGSILRQKEQEVQVALRIEKSRREQEAEQQRQEQQRASWRRGILHVEGQHTSERGRSAQAACLCVPKVVAHPRGRYRALSVGSCSGVMKGTTLPELVTKANGWLKSYDLERPAYH